MGLIGLKIVKTW